MSAVRRVARWEFPYEPLAGPVFEDVGCDLVVATQGPVDPSAVERAVRSADGECTAESLLSRAPLFWTRARLARPLGVGRLTAALKAEGVAVRYVVSATRPAARLAPALACDRGMRATPTDWPARRRTRMIDDPQTSSRWFMGELGLGVDRARCGTGEGTRLAVLDDDGAEADRVGFEREIPVGVGEVCRASPHGTLVAAWAIGTIGECAFQGVAPSASARLYGIPKAGTDVVSVPLAIARAVFDGADVVVCATYVEQMWSPLFDDALEVAVRLGRRGRGAAVVMPSGRQASSPPRSTHASWSLSLGDPASDPRVFCVGPSARGGGWFLWRDRRGRLRPFANRGPALRWLAPGDDLADPLEPGDRWCHAESSGAAALAAGVLLLVLGVNPTLRRRDLDAAILQTVRRPPPRYEATLDAPVADPFDLLPLGPDPDGHDAKHGYGRMNARGACLSVKDPIVATLLALGEEASALAVDGALSRSRPYSKRLARWAARRILTDRSSSHALRVVLRHLRLVAASPERATVHGSGAIARHFVLWLRSLAETPHTPARVAAELALLAARIAEPELESSLLALASSLLAPQAGIDDAPGMVDSGALASA